MSDELITKPNNYNEIIQLVENQACDESLWFEAQTVGEAILQRELRKLHYVIEECE